MHPMWHAMFTLTMPLLEKVLRPLIVYAFLVAGLRLAGKRELAQLNPFDLVVLLTLSNTVQNAIIGDDSSVTGGLIGAATLLTANYLVARFLFSHDKLDRMVEGEPDALIENGVVREDRLKQELLTRKELEIAAHRQGFAGLQEIERATIEPGGTIYFVGKRPSPNEAQQRELLERLDAIARRLDEMRARLPGRGDGA